MYIEGDTVIINFNPPPAVRGELLGHGEGAAD